ncbi:hypothetical protein F5890DRAFT_1479587 [Lentinula detonsa]|uniref:3'-5' exonuclease n=1 Tax=Lentinula detonsa TaxID=2804962 RepID=A0AA38QAW3_9AGAR|nr:hypothetical protein F5890DRAFT_1479587 [Lentinula detonsa]
MSSAGPISSAASMKSYYLKSEPQASVTLRYMANGLNAAAYESFQSPDTHPPPHIGFDLEWKPNFRPGTPENPIAVVQIAYQTASYVIHVREMRHLPDGLVEILENPRIVKVGVGIQNDAKKLYRDLRVCLNSCVDLSLFVKCVDSGLFAERLDRYANVPFSSSPPAEPPSLPPNCQPWEFYNSETFLGPHFSRLFRGPYSTSIGLARLSEIYEGLVLTKGKITRSNWDAELTPAQITYAALDAYAGSIVYTHLTRLFNLLESTKRPKRKYFAFDCIRGTLYNCCGDDRRTLPGEQMEDTELVHFENVHTHRTFHPVEEEIALHLQGVGTDQPRGFVAWNPSNPEYDPGPLPPKKTPEEKEAMRKQRQKRRDEKRKEEEAQNEGIESITEVGTLRNGNPSVNHTAVSDVPRPKGMLGPNRGHAPKPMTYAPIRNRPATSALAIKSAPLSRPSAKPDMNDINTSMKALRISQTPGALPSSTTTAPNPQGSNHQTHGPRKQRKRKPHSQISQDVRG